jgi:hypothetical protein
LSDYEEENKKSGATGATETSRLSLNFREKEHKERQALRDNFLAFEQGCLFLQSLKKLIFK